MRKLFIALVMAASVSAMATDYPVIPAPASYVAGEGTFTLPSAPSVAFGKGVDAKKIVSELQMRGITPAPGHPKNVDIRFELQKNLAPEAYTLDVTPKGISVTASSPDGFFYAVQTLAQLAVNNNGVILVCSVADEPRYSFRSLMLDPVRWFIPKDEVLRMIDVASAMKLNKLHLHLTDDNGWRVEIKKYPRLTEVGAWRVDRPEYFPGRMNQLPGEPATVGGFYTQDDLREIVAYAADRHITVIPEIDVPAHSAAAIASYPELACPVTDKFVGVFPGIGGPDASIILCAGNDKVYDFYEDVIDELIDIFPSEYIHLGGDEAEKSHWEKCPLCNERKNKEGLADFEELQGYFMDRLNRYVQSKGRKVIAWDEVTLGHPKEENVILGWNGMGNAAIEYAKSTGSRFVLSPARVLYLIRYQGPQWFEPFTYFGNNTLLDVYSFEPVKENWSPELKNQLLGIQGSLWSEFITSPEHLEYQLFPRMVAIADNAWRQQGTADWPAFIEALDVFNANQLDTRDITHARSMFNLDHKVRPADGALSVEVSCIRPDVEIRYSFDDPSLVTHKVYDKPLKVNKPSKFYAATFRNGRQEGQTLILDLDFNSATGMKADAPTSNNAIPYVLTNGLRGSDRNSDFEWAGWHDRTAEFVLDLGQSKKISSAKIGALANTHICIAAPRRVTLYGSENGNDFTEIASVELPDEIVWHKGAKITDIDFGQLDAKARYLRFVAENPGRIPDGFARATAPSWIYFDEVIIN